MAIKLYHALVYAFVLQGLAFNAGATAVQSYIAVIVPPEQLGQSVGLLELAWAGSSLLGFPIMGEIIHRSSIET